MLVIKAGSRKIHVRIANREDADQTGKTLIRLLQDKCGSRGGDRGSDPPGKSQVIWVSIGNKQLDFPLEKLDPLGKCWTPSGTSKNDRFL